MNKKLSEKPYGKSTTKGFRGLFNSFKYAINGVISCFLHERNMRIHTIATIYVFFFAYILQFNIIKIIVLSMVCGGVLICELFNSAIELLCDLVMPNYHKKAGILKDMAAGGVFLSALVAFFVGVALFFDKECLTIIINYFDANKVMFVLFVISVFVSIYLIFGSWTEKI